MKTIVCLVLVCLLPGAVLAQTPAAATVQRAEMKKLDWLVGSWKGTGWIQMGPQARREFTQVETIQSKLDGLLLMIEGQGKSQEKGSTVHTALALVSYDERAKSFRWRAFLADGRQTDTEAKVGTNVLEWIVQGPQRQRMRYTIKLNEKGEWFEVGEVTSDDESWHKFFEMTLQRQK